MTVQIIIWSLDSINAWGLDISAERCQSCIEIESQSIYRLICYRCRHAFLFYSIKVSEV